MSHSDDLGLVLPSQISPIQVQIINVQNTDQVESASEQLAKELNQYRVGIDRSDKTFGFKISEAEIKGIPIRIEVGPRDLANNQVMISRRDTRQKMAVPIDEVQTVVKNMIQEYDQNIYQIALQNREQRTSHAETLAEYQNLLDENQGFVLVPFCGDIACEEDVKKKTSTNSRCIPFDVEQTKGKCFNCQKDSELRVYFARAY